MRFPFIILLITCYSYLPAQSVLTVFEQSKGSQTATYEQGVAFYRELAGNSPIIQMQTFGPTDSGEPLRLILISGDGTFDIEKIRNQGKAILLINNAIHPGEPDGVEASMMLARDIAANPAAYRAILDRIVIGIIPFYNIGGVLNRNSHTRANQNGPEEYGFRGNARHYDLNRDFIKCDTRNAASFQGIFHYLDPDVFIDTHTSNGADYQYVLTIIPTQKDKLGGPLGEYLDQTMMPFLYDHMAKNAYEMTPYVSSLGRTPEEQGITDFLEGPRYSTGYAALFHTIGFMPETHMLKPFAQRVEATSHFLEGALKVVHRDKDKILDARRRQKEAAARQTVFPLTWTMDTTRHETITFKGYEVEYPVSPVTGGPRMYYNREKPFEKEIPYYHRYLPDLTVEKPAAYLIPQGWFNVVEQLQRNGVEMERLPADTSLTVTAYLIDDYQTSRRPYEGHYPHFGVQARRERQTIRFRAGDWYVPLNQPRNRYLLETLEPQAPDAYFAWNYFDPILQQKEYFSSYVFEDRALELLAQDPELKAEFEARKAADPEFAGNGRAQLDFIYKRSPHYEPEHLRYPVFRLE
jgi:hypothetical protein